jgi:hypothetical protein
MSETITKNDLKAIFDEVLPQQPQLSDVQVKGASVVSSGVATVSLSNLGVHTSTTAPTASDGDDGDVWFVYTA